LKLLIRLLLGIDDVLKPLSVCAFSGRRSPVNTRTWWNAVRFAWDAGELGRPWFGGGRLVLPTVVHGKKFFKIVVASR
jgi:hypothetical protein